jgi:choline dehydrogenase-like flavoprotein
MDQRLVPLPEQVFGELAPLRAHIVMRRSTDRGLERAGKMEAAQACDRSQAGECQITFQIGSDVIEHTRQSASIKSCLSCTGGDIARQRADVVLDQPCESFGGAESIADGSVMPRITIGNTTARCVIIGEPARQLLRSEHKLQMILPAP